MVDIQIPDPNVFYFPRVFPEYYYCQKVLSPYPLALWRFFQSKMVVLSLKNVTFQLGFPFHNGGYRQIKDSNLFHFPGVFTECYHCQKVLSQYLLPFWSYYQSKMVFSLSKMSNFQQGFPFHNGGYRQITDPNHFYFPRVFPEFMICIT